uniref:RNA-directed DNA polymerase, eukaryota n=1 Tax=Tanacetum cinerariifolium TaxID=118510 RepID=A0A6L2NSC6_TANCI|nr:RNA-directed DNA polymerase, eukaryota [Tanacetum cinerariifolium]
MDAEDDSSLPFKKVCVVTNHNTIINDKIKIIIRGQLYWIRVKELNAWTPKFIDEGSDTSFSDEEDIDGKENAFDSDKELDHVSESSCMNNYKMKANTQDFGNEQRPISEDPFEIYELLNKKKDKKVSKKQVSKDEGPTFPHGFTPNDVDDTVDGKVSGSNKQPNSDSHTSKDGFSGMNKGSNPSLNFKTGGSILQVMEDLVEVGQTVGYNMERKFKVNFVAIQETKLETIDLFAINALWGNFAFDFAISPSVGYSGGLLCVWDPNMLSKESEYISHMINLWEGESIILDDFNEVKAEHERFGTTFNKVGANAFNYFISSAGFIDLPLEGYSYTWAHKSASKMSKLDGFLISEGLISVFPSLSALCLDRHLSDRRPILMRELVVDYGPSSFRVFHLWFFKDSFDKLVEDLAQKAKIRWSIEGVKNSKYVHEIINKKRSQLAIRGVLVDGDWIEEPHKQLSDEQNEFLESNVTYEEIKKAVWDCGINRSLGLTDLLLILFIDIGRSWIKMWLTMFMNSSIRGLKINIQKSKLMGIGIPQEEVTTTANFIGCSIFSTPFNYLGVKVAKLSDSSLMDSFRRPPRGGVEEEQLLGLIDNVDSVILSNSNDRWVWSLESSGEFSVKTVRSHIDDFCLPLVSDPTRWIKIVPIKINVFAWKVRFDRLSTRINLSLRGIDLPSIICPICCCTGETCSHLLFNCNVARSILCKVARRWE